MIFFYLRERIKAINDRISELKMALENSQRYIILGSKLLPLFVEKLFADTKRAKPGAPSQEGNDADHEVTKWALIAQSFSEADVKQATRGFKISQYWQGIMNVLANYSEVRMTPPCIRAFAKLRSVCPRIP